jgi:DNA-binding CsgD family transcriptional regulator
VHEHRLAQSVSSGDWDAVAVALDESFFFHLFTDPDLIDRVFDGAPSEWYERYPRAVMSREIARAARRPVMLLDADVSTRFAAWVRSQSAPEARDVLGMRAADMRGLLTAGRYREAAAVADGAADLIRTTTSTAGFPDVLPLVLLQCGTAKLLAAELEDAVSMYSDALRWARVGVEHPAARYVREHLALAYALAGRYREARQLLPEVDASADLGPGNLHFHYRQAGRLARALVAVGAGGVRAGELSEPNRADVAAGVWWWVPAHARARAALVSGTQWAAIHDLGSVLVAERTRCGSRSFVGAVLRADLATLHQSVGDLRQAHRIAHTPGLLNRWGGLGLARARQAWLSGDPETAMALLQGDESADGIPIDHPAERAVLYAAAELSATGSVAEHTIAAVASALESSEGWIGLAQASAALRESLAPLLDGQLEQVPVRFAPRSRPKLTRREREVLEGLARSASIPELAQALHVSPNTVKSHVRALYQKLGAHTREEALWLGRETS